MKSEFEKNIDKAVKELKAEAGVHWLPTPELEERAKKIIPTAAAAIRANLDSIDKTSPQQTSNPNRLKFDAKTKTAVVTDFCRALFGCGVSASYEQIEATIDNLPAVDIHKILEASPHTFLHSIYEHYSEILNYCRQYAALEEKADLLKKASTPAERQQTATYKVEICNYFKTITHRKASTALYLLYNHNVNAYAFLPFVRANNIEEFFNNCEKAAHEYRYLLYYTTCKYTLKATEIELQDINISNNVEFVFENFQGKAKDVAQRFARMVESAINCLSSNIAEIDKQKQQADTAEQKPSSWATNSAALKTFKSSLQVENVVYDDHNLNKRYDILDAYAERPFSYIEKSKSGQETKVEVKLTYNDFLDVWKGLFEISNTLRHTATKAADYTSYKISPTKFTEICKGGKNREYMAKVAAVLSCLKNYDCVLEYDVNVKNKNGKGYKTEHHVSVKPLIFKMADYVIGDATRDTWDIRVLSELLENQSRTIAVESDKFTQLWNEANGAPQKRFVLSLLYSPHKNWRTLIDECAGFDEELKAVEKKARREAETAGFTNQQIEAFVEAALKEERARQSKRRPEYQRSFMKLAEFAKSIGFLSSFEIDTTTQAASWRKIDGRVNAIEPTQNF